MVVGGPVRGLRHVGIDEEGVARRATEHLIGLGHRDIAHIGGDDEEGLNREVPLGRKRGWQKALAHAGLPVRDDRFLTGRFNMAISKVVTAEMLRRPGDRPTAIFAGSDEMAMGAMLAIADFGLRVPEDISVIGVDDHDLSPSFGLTTMAQDPYRQGAMAARILLDELGGGEARTRSVRQPVPLIERTSTASPPTRA
jgi:DNA-binding LacI/PurR family transcriptional regulator